MINLKFGPIDLQMKENKDGTIKIISSMEGEEQKLVIALTHAEAVMAAPAAIALASFFLDCASHSMSHFIEKGSTPGYDRKIH